MRDKTPQAKRRWNGLLTLLSAAMLAGCAAAGDPPTPGSAQSKAQSPLASPPASIMTPHGY